MDYKDMLKRWISEWGPNPEFEYMTAKELSDRFYTHLEFGTAGMRGTLGSGYNRMNRQNVMLTTQGLADYILKTPGGRERGVAIAYDSRRLSDAFASLTAEVLAGNGIKCFLYDSLRPVPVLSFTLRELGCIAGVVITASHNPPEYNGYKVYWEDGGQMPPERASAVLELIRAQSARTVKRVSLEHAIAAGDVIMIGKEMDDKYMERVRALSIDPEATRALGATFNVVYTPLNGSGNKPVRRILSEIGFTNVHVVREQQDPDPDFTTVGTPNPENPGAYTLAYRLAEQVNADMIFGTDPDCDRLGVAVKDNAGAYIVLSGNQIGCLLQYYLLENLKRRSMLPANGAVIKSVVSTEMSRAIADAYDITTMDVMTGFKFIAEKIQLFEDTGSHTFLFGFEESYGYLTGTFVRDKDAVIASMLICQAAAWYKSEGYTLYQALLHLYDTFGHYREDVVSITLTGEDGLKRMAALMAAVREHPPEAFGTHRVLRVRDYLTGLNAGDIPRSNALYYELDGGAWVCVRPSGTEPKIKLYVNTLAKTADAADADMTALKASAAAAIGAGA